MIFLYAFLVIILILAILLFCPVFVHISFKENLRVNIKFLFFSFDLLQKKEFKKIEKDAKILKKDNKINKFAKKLGIIKERGLSGFLDLLKQLVRIARDFAGKIHIRSFYLDLLVAEDDAAKTAVSYGKASAFVNYARSILLRNVDERKCHILTLPGFREAKSRVDFSFNVYFFPISMLSTALISIYRLAKGGHFNTKTTKRV